MTSSPNILLDVQHLSQQYALPKPSLFAKAGHIQALNDVSFQLAAGKSVGIVGESGSGKSTLARLVMALEKPTQGKVMFKGQDLNALPQDALRRARSDFQMVFQDPYGSLDPRQKVFRIVSEPLSSTLNNPSGQALNAQALSPQDLKDRAAQALTEVGLRASDLDKYPHEFSGGQRQRIAIARALITRPSLIVADEPVSALDVSVQAQVLNLMMDLQERYGLSYLFVSHDLAVVNLMCDDVLVLQHGQLVEAGSADDIFLRPQHPYTQELLSANTGLSH
ncbi:MAG: Oligopeptide transport ATP-binding protein OppF [Pseudomonadota bacterium]